MADVDQIPPFPPADSPELSPEYCHSHGTIHTDDTEGENENG